MKHMMAMALMAATIGLVSCTEKEPAPQEPAEQGGDPCYVFHSQGETLEPGQTIEYYPKADEVSDEWATTQDILIENITSSDLQSVLKLEKVSGSAAFDDVMFCFGEACTEQHCPWTSNVVTLTPGINENLPIHIQYNPLSIESETVYRITIGKGTGLANSQTVLINIKGAE